jgi:hypothetical protein
LSFSPRRWGNELGPHSRRRGRGQRVSAGRDALCGTLPLGSKGYENKDRRARPAIDLAPVDKARLTSAAYREAAKLRAMGATLQYLFYNAVVSVGSTLVTLGAAYKLFGERLIERLFGHLLDGRLQKEKERHELALANLKHEQDAQIEDLRAKIAHLSDRGKHSNEREYAALSAIWEKFVDLYYATDQCIVGAMQYPDLTRMSEAQISEFLDTTEFDKAQKLAVQNSKDKSASFSHIVRRIWINKAQSIYYEMKLFLHKQGSFIPKSMKEEFDAAAALCSAAIAHRYVEERGARLDRHDDLEFRSRGPKTLETIKDHVRDRLLREYDPEAGKRDGPGSR